MKSLTKWLVAALLSSALFPLSASAVPVVAATDLSPSAGSKFGATSLVISGTNFLDGSSNNNVVSVDLSVSNTVTPLSFTVSSTTRVDAFIPSGSYTPGAASIIVSYTASPSTTFAYSFLGSLATQSSIAVAPAIGAFNLNLLGYGFTSKVSSAFISTSNAVFSASFSVTSNTVVSVSAPVIDASSRSKRAFVGLTFNDGTPNSLVEIQLAGPTVSATVPAFGSAAGGNSVTISGQGFVDGNGQPAVTRIMFGSDLITSSNFTVVNATTITVSIPVRSGNAKTVGANKVAVYYASDISSSQTVYYYFSPFRDEAQDTPALVQLNELASRSERKPIFRTTVAPFFVYGTDSLTKQAYEYETNTYYGTNAAYAREGGQPGYSKRLQGGSLTTTQPGSLNLATISSRAVNSTYTGGGNTYTMRRDATLLKSDGNCSAWNNSMDSGDGQGPVTTYCTVFGPEVYSEAFYGQQGQSLAFDWLAIGETDDYSVYAYLVAVQDETNIPKTDVASHTLVAHGVGRYGVTSRWQTSTGEIPTSGLYRFRFVNGSFDGTGGQAIGSTFAISSVFDAGLTNRINFGPISDQFPASGSVTKSASALSGGEVTISSRTTNVCTVTTTYSAPNTTVTINKLSTGTCILVASRGQDGEYAPAADKLVAFEIRAAATSASAPVITQVNSGDQQLGIIFAPPSRDGGYEVTSYEYSTDGGLTWASASPTSTASSMVITTTSNTGVSLSNGVTYSIQVRAITNLAVPTGAASNTATGVPNAPAAPVINYSNASILRTVGVPTQILAPANSGGAVTTWTVTSGSLPSGLSLNSSTGIISGNPSATGSSTVGITGTNSTSTSNVATLTITIVSVAANAPSISWPVGVSGVYTTYVGTQFTAGIPANANTSDSALFTIQPALPNGLSIDAVTGVVSGVATVLSSQVSYVISATNGAGVSTISFVLTVLPAGSGSSAGATPIYNGPEITSVVPNVVSTAGGETIVVTGKRLGNGMDVTIGGVTVAIRGASATGFTFTMPSLTAATYDMIYRYDGGASLKYLNAITVKAPNAGSGGSNDSGNGGSNNSGSTPGPWSAVGIANMFAPGSSVVNPQVRAQVVSMIRQYGSIATKVECTGFTMGPTVLKRDAALSRARALAVCALIKDLRPRLVVVKAVGKQETKLGGVIRRVEVLFTRG